MEKVRKTYTGNSKKPETLLICALNAHLTLYYVTISSIVLFTIVLVTGIDLLPDYLYIIVVVFLTLSILSLYGVEAQNKSLKSWYETQNFIVKNSIEVSDEKIMISIDNYMEANISWASLHHFSNKEKYIELWIAGTGYRINKKFLDQEEIDTILRILDRQMELKRMVPTDNQA